MLVRQKKHHNKSTLTLSFTNPWTSIIRTHYNTQELQTTKEYKRCIHNCWHCDSTCLLGWPDIESDLRLVVQQELHLPGGNVLFRSCQRHPETLHLTCISGLQSRSPGEAVKLRLSHITLEVLVKCLQALFNLWHCEFAFAWRNQLEKYCRHRSPPVTVANPSDWSEEYTMLARSCKSFLSSHKAVVLTHAWRTHNRRHS